MKITINEKDYEFKEEPTTRDLMKIGMEPEYNQRYKKFSIKLIEMQILKLYPMAKRADEDYVEKFTEVAGSDGLKQFIMENQDKIPIPTSAEFTETLEYKGRVLNTLYLGTDIEDWLDTPSKLLNKVLSHQSIVNLITNLYG